MHRPMLATGDQCGNLILRHPIDCRPNDGGFIRTSGRHDAPNLGVQAAVCTNDDMLVTPVFVTQI